jgi:hypothetical protein
MSYSAISFDVIARSLATRQSSVAQTVLDCFASLAMTKQLVAK